MIPEPERAAALIAKCERLLKDITPGEWVRVLEGIDDGAWHPAHVQCGSRYVATCASYGTQRDADAAFIAAAPRLVRDLLRILEGREQGAHEERRAEGPGGEP